jgi:hypothetical protein
MAIHHANMMPPPNERGPVEVDRKAAMAAVGLLETPSQARARVAAGVAGPRHYVPTPPTENASDAPVAVSGPYK